MPKFRVGPAELHYLDTGKSSGSGAAVIFLHSSAMSGTQWRDIMAELGSEFRLLAPDFYGYGKSDSWPGPAPLTLDAELTILVEMMALADGEAHLVAHSYGAAIALQGMTAGLGNVLSLTAYEPVAFHLLAKGSQADLTDYEEILKIAELVWANVAVGDNDRAMQVFVDYWNGAGTWQGMGDDSRTALAAQAPKVGQDFTALFSLADNFDNYAALDQPTLLLVGDRTPTPTRHLTDLLVDALPNSKKQIIVGAGHMGPITHRQQVNTEILRFLRAQV